jgi:RHS repeat-associated protein
MPEGNPLVASAQSDTTAVTGIGIAESSVDLANGISSGDWVAAGLGAVGVGLEVLSMVIDPIGTVASYGVSWLIEHVRPLKEALDWFAGDPPVIRSFSETWGNVAAEVGRIAADYGNEVKTGTAGWTGQASDTYRGKATETADAIAGAGALADGISAGVMIMGEVVAAVRELVRDLVAEIVGKLITWALEAVATLGLGTPVIVAQATAAISKVVNKIADLVRKLVKTIGNVTPRIRKVIDKLDEIIAKLGKLGRKGDAPGSTSPSSAKTPGTQADGPSSPGTDTSGTGTGTDEPGVGGNGTQPGRDGAPGDDVRSNTSPETSREANGRRCENDPIDVASGEMVLSQFDLRLPGALPLVLARTHISAYRVGRGFGRSWASTLDQRIEAAAGGLYFAAADGMLLAYPLPTGESPVLPEHGPRWPLTATASGYTITNPVLGQSLHFAPGNETTVLALRAMTDRNGNRIDFDYAPDGTFTGIRHSGGYHLRAETSEGLITALHLGAVRVVSYRYDEARRLTEVINSSGRGMRYEYDSEGRITRWQDRTGRWFHYVYDDRGRCVRTGGPDGYLAGTFEYSERVTTYTDSLGHRKVFHFNEDSQVVREVDALGNVTVSEWDSYDNLLSRTDPLGRTVRYSYDADGNLIGVTRPDGTAITVWYNALQLPVRTVYPDGATWHQEYDDRGNLTAVTDPTGAVTQYGYDAQGHLLAVTDPVGNTRRIQTNAAGLPVAVTDAMSARTVFTRDVFGRVAAMTDPIGGVTRFSWTVEGKLASRILPDGSTERWRYDSQGNMIEHVDAAGNHERFETTHFGRLAARTDAGGERTEYTYDTELRLVAVTNPHGQVWRYDYDPAGNLLREKDFNGREMRYGYDAAGQLIEFVNGVGDVVRYRHDPLGNVVRREVGSDISDVATFAYDSVGRMVRATNRDADLVLTRDPLGRITAETTNGRTLTSAYDALGRRVHRRTASGVECTWEFDGNHKPSALHTAGVTLRFGRDAAGREIERIVGDTVLSQIWDGNHRLRSQSLAGSVPDAQLIQRRSYSYRQSGHLVAIVDQLSGARQFDLDPAGRITAVHGHDWTEQYAYDSLGNIAYAASADASAAGEREYAGTLIQRAGETRYTHDAQGRIVQRRQRDRTWRYDWDPHDQLSTVVTPGGEQWRYSYDALGRRIGKQRLDADGSVAERVDFTWDGRVLAEQAHDGRTTTWDWEPGTFRAVSQQESIDAQFYAIVTDMVGTPAELVTPDGTVAWQGRTTLWGVDLNEDESPADCPLRFPGQYRDQESGLNYNYHRYYDPLSGRYASPDPLGLAAGPNPHAYVSNAMHWIDPLGLSETTVFYRGMTWGALQEVVDNQALDADRIRANQAAMPPANGPGAYLTQQEDTARYYADLAGGNGRGMGPGVLRVEVPSDQFDEFARRHGLEVETPVPQPPTPGQTETRIPMENFDEFDRMATYSDQDDQPNQDATPCPSS